MVEQSVDFGVATRPHPHEVVNGDSWAIDWHGPGCRVAVIDGLGHGPAAAEASNTARTKLTEHPEFDPIEALAACHRALTRTRGASMSVAQVNPLNRQVIYAGVGNVETRLWHDGRAQRLMNYRGIIGARVPALRAFTLRAGPRWILVMHSDGVSARFEMSEVLKIAGDSPQSLAETILNKWGRDTDDATVLVIAASSAFPAE